MSAVAAEDGMRFMQEMMELSSQQQKEQLPPRAVQIVSHPFFGRVVLTAGPAQFGLDLYKSSSGVSMITCDFLFCTFSLFFCAYFCAVLGLFLLKGMIFFFYIHATLCILFSFSLSLRCVGL